MNTSIGPVVVQVNQISKQFTLRKDKSFKERLVAFSASQKHREDFEALKDVTFEVKAGSTIALIGHNGSGKSTLLKIIGGILEPSSGSVLRRGRVAALLELGAGFHPDLSGRDNVYLNASLLGLSRAETDLVFEKIVEFAEIEDFIDTQVKFYSSGMYVRLAFAVAIHVNPDILLVDEVLAVGDEAFQSKCMNVIRRFQAEGRTIILVTHSMDQVLDLADFAILLHHGDKVFQGEPREAVVLYRDLLDQNRSANSVQTSEPENGALKANDFSLQATYQLSLDGAHVAVLKPGGCIQLDVALTSSRILSNYILEVEIESSTGHMLFCTDTAKMKVTLPSAVSEANISFVFDKLFLGQGKYYVNARVKNSHKELLFERRQIAVFNVISFDYVSGLVSPKTTAHVSNK